MNLLNNITWLVNHYAVCPRISKLISKNKDSYKGWYRFGEKPEIMPTRKEAKTSGGRKKVILQFDMNGIFISEWPSLCDVAKNLHLSQGTLSTRINENKSYKGFIWKIK